MDGARNFLSGMEDSRLIESKVGVKVDVGLARTVQANVPNVACVNKPQAPGKTLPITVRVEDIELKTRIHGRLRLPGTLSPILLLVAATLLFVGHVSLYLQVRGLEGRNQALELQVQMLLCQFGENLPRSEHIGISGITCAELGGEDEPEWEDDEVDAGNIGRRKRRDASSGIPVDVSNSSLTFPVMGPKKRHTKMRRNAREPRAVYLVPSGPLITIENKDQMIGPWLFLENGASMGFGDRWYGNLELGSSNASVIFRESGLFLIYAQVYYYKYRIADEKQPMGFRIFLRKNPESRPNFKRPIPLAECVAAYPKTEYQTCFTQVAWHIDEADEVYLEHFLPGLPQIENDGQGQTFLGIVKL